MPPEDFSTWMPIVTSDPAQSMQDPVLSALLEQIKEMKEELADLNKRFETHVKYGHEL